VLEGTLLKAQRTAYIAQMAAKEQLTHMHNHSSASPQQAAAFLLPLHRALTVDLSGCPAM
jgi:hypothetical protein